MKKEGTPFSLKSIVQTTTRSTEATIAVVDPVTLSLNINPLQMDDLLGEEKKEAAEEVGRIDEKGGETRTTTSRTTTQRKSWRTFLWK